MGAGSAFDGRLVTARLRPGRPAGPRGGL